MYKPIVFNRHLNKKWNEKENDIMLNKLSTVKPKVDIKCPESYMFYKTQFKRTQVYNNGLKDIEIRRNNQNLVEKIMNIFTSSPAKENKKKQVFTLKKSLNSQTRKWEIFKIAQENQQLLKRLNDRQSFYDSKAWGRDYSKTRVYKKNLCVFPSIDFDPRSRTSESARFETPKYPKSANTRLKMTDFSLKNKGSMTDVNFNPSKTGFNSSTNIAATNEVLDRKVLFKKNVFLGDLHHCIVKFYIENKKFTIEIIPVNNQNKNYYIIFDDIEEISKIQSIYKKYDQMINDIVYEVELDKVFIKNINRENIKLYYNTFMKLNNNKTSFIEDNNEKKEEGSVIIRNNSGKKSLKKISDKNLKCVNELRSNLEENTDTVINDQYEYKNEEKKSQKKLSNFEEEKDNHTRNANVNDKKSISNINPEEDYYNTKSDKKSNIDEFISYKNAKESSKTVSRASLKSQDKNLISFDKNNKTKDNDNNEFPEEDVELEYNPNESIKDEIEEED